MDRKIFGIGFSALVVVGLAAPLTITFSRPPSFRGTEYGQPYSVAPQIELIRSTGETFRLSVQKGKIILLFFGIHPAQWSFS